MTTAQQQVVLELLPQLAEPELVEPGVLPVQQHAGQRGAPPLHRLPLLQLGRLCLG